MLKRRGRLGSFKKIYIRKYKSRFNEFSKKNYKKPEHISRKGNSRNIFSRGFLPLIVTFIVALALLYFSYQILDRNLRPTIDKMSTTIAHQLANETIYHVFYEDILPNVNYKDLIIVHKDAQNQVSFIQANSMEIGMIITKAGREIKEALRALPDMIIEIPLGQALGISVLANRGPKLTMKLTPMGTVDVTVSDKFEQAGINQVKHTIYIEISTEVNIVIPLVSKEELIEMKMPLAESIIVGPVPDTYLGGGIPLQSIGISKEN